MAEVVCGSASSRRSERYEEGQAVKGFVGDEEQLELVYLLWASQGAFEGLGSCGLWWTGVMWSLV